uniref:Uncharacterized protein n=1 Tax=Ditylenchus dipsaci TaxID=166011 RepID=A0A915DE79_9BILA
MPITKAMPSPTSAQPSSQAEPATENSRLKLAAASNVLGDPSVDGNDRRTKIDCPESQTPQNGRIRTFRWRERWSILSQQDTQIRLQSGTNQFDSQRGMTGLAVQEMLRGTLKTDLGARVSRGGCDRPGANQPSSTTRNSTTAIQQQKQQQQRQPPQQVPPQQQQQLGRPAPQQAALTLNNIFGR